MNHTKNMQTEQFQAAGRYKKWPTKKIYMQNFEQKTAPKGMFLALQIPQGTWTRMFTWTGIFRLQPEPLPLAKFQE